MHTDKQNPCKISLTHVRIRTVRDVNAVFTEEEKFTTWGNAIVSCGVVRLIWSAREYRERNLWTQQSY